MEPSLEPLESYPMELLLEPPRGPPLEPPLELSLEPPLEPPLKPYELSRNFLDKKALDTGVSAGSTLRACHQQPEASLEPRMELSSKSVS